MFHVLPTPAGLPNHFSHASVHIGGSKSHALWSETDENEAKNASVVLPMEAEVYVYAVIHIYKSVHRFIQMCKSIDCPHQQVGRIILHVTTPEKTMHEDTDITWTHASFSHAHFVSIINTSSS